MKMLKNRLTVICLQALNWETIQPLGQDEHNTASPPFSFTQMYMAHFSPWVLSNKSIYIRRARHEQIKCVISICTTASFDLLTCRAWVLPLWIRFTKTKVIWHVIQFGVSLGPALFKQGSVLARLWTVCQGLILHEHICVGKYLNGIKSAGSGAKIIPKLVLWFTFQPTKSCFY